MRSGRRPAPRAGAAAAPPPPPPDGRDGRQQALHTVLLDSSVFDAPATSRPAGRSSTGKPASVRAPASPGKRGSPARGGGGRQPLPGAVHMDKGESEAAFIGTLRTHFARNGTAESFAPKFAAAPLKTYSRSDRGGGAPEAAAPAAAPAPAAPLSLADQERRLWEEREGELAEAQDRRFTQLEDALAAREAKREAYLVHRLESVAAAKIEAHRRTQQAAARARELAVQRVQQLPGLRSARAATHAASPTAALAAAARAPQLTAPPSLARALQQAATSLPDMAALHAVLNGSPARGALDAGPSLQGWQAKQQAAAARSVATVYQQIQAVRAAGAAPLAPLDAAKGAASRPISGAGRSRSPAAAAPPAEGGHAAPLGSAEEAPAGGRQPADAAADRAVLAAGAGSAIMADLPAEAAVQQGTPAGSGAAADLEAACQQLEGTALAAGEGSGGGLCQDSGSTPGAGAAGAEPEEEEAAVVPMLDAEAKAGSSGAPLAAAAVVPEPAAPQLAGLQGAEAYAEAACALVQEHLLRGAAQHLSCSGSRLGVDGPGAGGGAGASGGVASAVSAGTAAGDAAEGLAQPLQDAAGGVEAAPMSVQAGASPEASERSEGSGGAAGGAEL